MCRAATTFQIYSVFRWQEQQVSRSTVNSKIIISSSSSSSDDVDHSFEALWYSSVKRNGSTLLERNARHSALVPLRSHSARCKALDTGVWRQQTGDVKDPSYGSLSDIDEYMLMVKDIGYDEMRLQRCS